jgi:flavin reductase (DIM6/NTAB) family NADH-FMN oxidoreductase RutF
MSPATGPFEFYHETMAALGRNGIILLGGDPPNPMTIGWGSIGEIWHMPVFTVLVRPTRYTFGLMENAKDFTFVFYRRDLKSTWPFAVQKAAETWTR